MLDASRRFVYVSKFPPSPSGIGLYAAVFEQVLARLGEVRRHPAPAEPIDSQRLSAALRGMGEGWRQGRRSPDEHIHVELSGRALFEFYYAVGALTAGAAVTVTTHDLPSVVGSPMLFTGLDRRVLRRLGGLLSTLIGHRLERYVLRRALAVCTLTTAGAEWLRTTYGVPAVSLGHVVDSPTPMAKERIIFCPGYIGDADPIRQLLNVIGKKNPEWRILVGATTQQAADSISDLLKGGRISASMMGDLDEESLLGTFARSQVVVRVRNHGGANTLAASGPLAWSVARGCTVITNDTRPGAEELEGLGLIQVTEDWLERIQEELGRPFSPGHVEDIQVRAQKELGTTAVACRFEELLRPVQATDGGG
ncbi:hypothetical protein [Janibacter indicus]|uniref:hypothetical protein n=1 Tax=Janibacter indicus TaxID=857417 RepID=UPI003EBFEA88